MLDGCSAVVHLAGLMRGSVPVLARANVEGTRHLCEAAARAGVSRFVNVSSLQADDRFPTEYGASKRAAEQVLRESRLDWTTIRPAHVYGAGDELGLTRVAAAAGRVPVIPVPGGGRSLVQPIYVGDVTRVLLQLLGAQVPASRTYELGGPEVLSLASFIARAARVQGRSILQIPIPVWMIRTVASVTARIPFTASLTPDVARGIALDKTADNGPAIRDLGFTPTGLDAGLEMTFGV